MLGFCSLWIPMEGRRKSASKTFLEPISSSVLVVAECEEVFPAIGDAVMIQIRSFKLVSAIERATVVAAARDLSL